MGARSTRSGESRDFGRKSATRNKAKGQLKANKLSTEVSSPGSALAKIGLDVRGGVARTAEVLTGELPPVAKLMIGAGGIYAAFMYYGLLQEGVFSYEAADGSKFKQVWFLMVLESVANVLVGFTGRQLTGPTKGLPLKLFAASGATQVFAKAFTNLALRYGVSFPVVTLAKSGKMVPVMLGSILLGGASYSMREYSQVAMIIGGTCMVSMAKKAKKATSSSSSLGLSMVMLSLACDGFTGGLQKRIKGESAAKGVKAKPYDFMFWTNWAMMWTALVMALAQGELTTGFRFVSSNPVILQKIGLFALCSAMGQSFIFYTIANFEPLVPKKKKQQVGCLPLLCLPPSS